MREVIYCGSPHLEFDEQCLLGTLLSRARHPISWTTRQDDCWRTWHGAFNTSGVAGVDSVVVRISQLGFKGSVLAMSAEAQDLVWVPVSYCWSAC